MKLIDFLLYLSKEKKNPTTRVVGFSTLQEYPLLFTALSREYIETHTKKSLEFINTKEISFDAAKAKLTTTFLGNSLTYALYGLHTLDTRTKKKWYQFINSYAGPHTICIFGIEPDIIKKIGVEIVIDKVISLRDAIIFLTLFSGVQKDKVEYFLSQCVKGMRDIPFESLCLLAYYIKVVGVSTEFFSGWVPYIFPAKTSLFQLSQYFFAKQPNEFFAIYKEIEPIYSQAFWTVFWSEQLWRAYGYVSYMHQKNTKDAKFIGTRLPFSFLNNDWQRYKKQELIKAHNIIYQLDIDAKHSRHHVGLDLFYAYFLYSEYKN